MNGKRLHVVVRALAGVGVILVLAWGFEAAAQEGSTYRVDSQSLLVAGGHSESPSFRAWECVDFTPSGWAASSSFVMATGCGAFSFITGLPVDEVQEPGPTGPVIVRAPQGECGPLLAVDVVPGPTPGQDPGFDYPLGRVSLDLACAPTGGTTTVTVLFSGALNWPPPAWRNWGPQVPGDSSTTAFYTLGSVTFGTIAVPGEGDVAAAFVTITDGQAGDNTVVDGRILSLGGPAFARADAIPTLFPIGLALFAAVLAAAALLVLGRGGLAR